MRFYADLHIHSKYSRATSKKCDLENLTYWGRKKGITVIGTGDFTHPAWIQEIKEKLVPAEEGLFRLRDEIEHAVSRTLPTSCHGLTRFMLSVEVSTIYKKGDKTRKVHHLIYAPTIEKAEKINQSLAKIGNIRSDGRPILGLDSRHLLEIVLAAGDDCYLVPAHIWTPWFSVLGSKSGFDAVADCYDDLAQHIFAVETGLSSDPEMNWRISTLDRYQLVSSSDAHSPPKLGREACVFDGDLDYYSMKSALETGRGYEGSVEFFPEEGKYHLDGHRKCGVRLSPEESRSRQGLCPVCKKPLTLGVMYRVEELSDRTQTDKPLEAKEFKNLIPLPEVISETLGVGSGTKRTEHEYENILSKLGAELALLSDLPLEEMQNHLTPLMFEAISRMRAGKVRRQAGYDGEYGSIRLFTEDELKRSVAVLFETEPRDPQTIKDPVREPPRSEGSLTSRKDEISQPDPIPDLFGDISSAAASSLDPDQRQALELLHGPVLIIAGPGSGKTRTLTHRVAQLITEGKAQAEQCLTITFTRRATEEMQERLKTLLPSQWSRIPITTFHALGLSILQENRVAAGLPRGFRVVSDLEREKTLMESLRFSARKAQRIFKEISRLKRNDLQPESDQDLQTAWSFLRQQTELLGWVDYDDLIALCVRLLDESPDLRLRYQRRYRWLSIDEYQDIDELQYRMIRQLVPKGGNICAIGDPDQAIYGFRGGDVSFFLRFEADFSNAQTIQLSRNYRSGKSILTASHQVIQRHSLVRDREALPIMADTGRLVIHPAPSDRAEAEFLVHTIEQLMGGISFFSLDSERSTGDVERDLSFSDFAVLYRTESLGDPVEEAFQRSGIPFQRRAHKRLSEQPAVPTLLERMQQMGGDRTVLDSLRFVLKGMQELEKLDDAVVAKLESIALLCGHDFSLFFSEINLGQEIDTWDPRADRVSLLTLHAAKGLEFSVVFIIGCEDGILPLSWRGSLTAEELAEERRLFYVGMTRAKERLLLSHAAKRVWQGKLRPRNPSPFIHDIETRLIEIRKSSAMKKNAHKALQLDLL